MSTSEMDNKQNLLKELLEGNLAFSGRGKVDQVGVTECIKCALIKVLIVFSSKQLSWREQVFHLYRV